MRSSSPRISMDFTSSRAICAERVERSTSFGLLPPVSDAVLKSTPKPIRTTKKRMRLRTTYLGIGFGLRRLGLRGTALFQRLQREAQTVLFRLDRDDFEFHGVADLGDVGDVLHRLLGELGDVRQAVDVAVQFDEEAERVDLEHLAFDHVADLVLVADALPGILDELLHGEEDLGALDADDLGLDGLADLHQVARVVDALPGDLGDVDQAL